MRLTVRRIFRRTTLRKDNAMDKVRKCQSYTIIDSIKAGEVEIVLGHSLTAAQPYATWKTYEHTGYEDFQHGHYFSDMQQARVDFYDRLKDAWINFSPAKNKTQEHNRPAPKKTR